MIKSIFYSLKRLYLLSKGVSIKDHCAFHHVHFLGKATIEPYCRIFGDPKITIGDNFYMNANCHILGNINIGDNVQIGPKTVIWGRDHGISRDELICNQEYSRGNIFIGDDVWIGANVTILKGVTIGNGAVVGAASVVTKDVPEYSVVAGNPCKLIKYRYDQTLGTQHNRY